MICSGQENPPRVYFERLLARPEYILKDSWQGADAEHMEIKDPQVGPVFGPICGPKCDNTLYLESYTLKMGDIHMDGYWYIRCS